MISLHYPFFRKFSAVALGIGLCLTNGLQLIAQNNTVTPAVLAPPSLGPAVKKNTAPAAKPIPTVENVPPAPPPPIILSPVDRPLHAAYQANDLEKGRQALIAGASPDAQSEDGDRLLPRAVRDDRTLWVQLLLDYCAQPHLNGKEQQAALPLAVIHRRKAALELLVKNRAEVDLPFNAPVPADIIALAEQPMTRRQLEKDMGVLPIMVATNDEQEDIIRLLLKHGANPDKQSRKWRYSAVSMSCAKPNLRLGRLLLDRDPDDTNPQIKVSISIKNQRAVITKGDQTVMSFGVSTGKKGYRTRTGEFLITSKHRDWTSTLYHAKMPYFMRLSCSDFGLHEGVVPGYPASHGCVRVPGGTSRKIFQLLRIGDHVVIEP
jgi:hypothetical protein